MAPSPGLRGPANYLLRILPPHLTADYAAAHDTSVARCLATLLQQGDMPLPPSRRAAQLAQRFGGLGLPSASDDSSRTTPAGPARRRRPVAARARLRQAGYAAPDWDTVQKLQLKRLILCLNMLVVIPTKICPTMNPDPLVRIVLPGIMDPRSVHCLTVTEPDLPEEVCPDRLCVKIRDQFRQLAQRLVLHLRRGRHHRVIQ